MRIGVPNEVRQDEHRVAIAPDAVAKILKSLGDGAEIVVEKDAGRGAFGLDSAYEAAGARIAGSENEVWESDIVVCVGPVDASKVRLMKAGGVLIGLLRPGQDKDFIDALVEKKVTALAFEAVPRITRAQSMDALSAMSTVAGYRAVILAAEASPKFFPMLMTAAGTVTASRVIILGAGVAGLQAIATARRLGAIVEAFDVRAATKEQVESLGARFIELDVGADGEGEGGYARALTEEEQQKQREALAERLVTADVIITTALIPGRPAPRLIEASTVRRMRPGSVIVDLAAIAGGNCELAKPDETVVENDVSILGPSNLPSEMPTHASLLYSRVVGAMLGLIVKEGEVHLDMEDEIVWGASVTHDGEVLHATTRELLGMAPLEKSEATA